ncbi:helix-turn-helix domain-containing protein [Acetobacterium tundrae]|uniref:Stage 0 sporulation protein A homolog n=1 Tax=Acetobacterium tundrae TaxID=132932 RepID=A0ABR6WGN2_9FIRM|nr:helix-turn-helix domain-containing protein [Acetobacterium tundrae]MBC3795623.1 helix-turn-helix domain-containing protein [Acetobacterium tundrae]
MYRLIIVEEKAELLEKILNLQIWNKHSEFIIQDTVQDGETAMELIRQNQYDLVIAEILTPFYDGLQILSQTRQENLSPCVVLMSEFENFAHARQGIIFGAFDYLVPPFSDVSMGRILVRASEFLSNQPIRCLEYSSMDKENDVIVMFFEQGEDSALNLLEKFINQIYDNDKNDVIHAEILVKSLYNSIIEEWYREFPWLHNFIAKKALEVIDDIHDKEHDTLRKCCFKNMKHLFKYMTQLYNKTDDELIHNMMVYILSSITDGTLNQKCIAKKFSVSNAYISNLFIAKTNRYFSEYFSTVKLIRAKYLLLNSDLKIYEVSASIGYKDINYFSKIFKTMFGKPPSELKKEYCMY